MGGDKQVFQLCSLGKSASVHVHSTMAGFSPGSLFAYLTIALLCICVDDFQYLPIVQIILNDSLGKIASGGCNMEKAAKYK